MNRVLLFILLLAQVPAAALSEGEVEVDSRQVFDLCAPDQIVSSEGARVEWGHYVQWKTNNGTAYGAGTLLAAPWNTCLEAPEYTVVEWKGQGKVSFLARGAHDAVPKGRNAPGAWSEWIRLGGDGTRLAIPRSIHGKQWIQLQCELGADARLSEFSIHK